MASFSSTLIVALNVWGKNNIENVRQASRFDTNIARHLNIGDHSTELLVVNIF